MYEFVMKSNMLEYEIENNFIIQKKFIINFKI